MQIPFPEELNPDFKLHGDPKLQRILTHLSTLLERDHRVGQITGDLQQKLRVACVVWIAFIADGKGNLPLKP